MKVVLAGVSDRGRVREENEDHFLAGGVVENRGALTLTLDSDGALMTDYGLLACVADGMGGYGGGAAASETALRALAAAFYAAPRTGADASRLAADVTAACAHAQQAVQELQRSDPALAGAGTTLAGVALLAPRRLAVFHVGDSRVLRWSAGMLRTLTVDHTPMGAQVAAGKITETEAVGTDTTNLLTRALGSMSAEAEVGIQTEWSPKDLFILGSDGWYGLGRGATRAAIEGRLAGGLSGTDLAGALLKDALAADGRDNATVVTVAFLEDPAVG